jgi:undecaprenyl-diphosphatase
VTHAPVDPHLSFVQAITIGLLQGVTELFPVSSLGHSVLVPALIGGSWHALVTDQTGGKSPYLAFIVGLHVATALALLCFFWRDWVKIIGGFVSSIRHRRVDTVYERMSWLIVVATIPAGIIGLALEHALRDLFAKPEAAAIFLTVNGGILFAGERLRRRSLARTAADGTGDASAVGAASASAASSSGADSVPASISGDDPPSSRSSGDLAPATEQDDAVVTSRVSVRDAAVIGVFQSLALLAGISRSGITMVAGLLRGLDHEQAVRFSFLLATPVILAAGVLKVPELFGSLGDGIRGQALAGGVAAFVGAIVSVKFLVRWFQTRTLTPFAWYCGIFGVICIVRFA